MSQEAWSRAIKLIRQQSEAVDPQFIRPNQSADFLGPNAQRGLCVWSQREAFVNLFATDQGFDADHFRWECSKTKEKLDRETELHLGIVSFLHFVERNSLWEELKKGVPAPLIQQWKRETWETQARSRSK
jgi:hypothetical protein